MKEILILKRENDVTPENREIQTGFMNAGIPTSICDIEQFEVTTSSMDGDHGFYYYGNKLDLDISFVLPRIGSNFSEFCVSVVQQFEYRDIPCYNSSAGILAARNKLETMMTLARAGIPVPKTVLLKFPLATNNLYIINKEIQYPRIVKVVHGSLGHGVYLCQNETEFKRHTEFLHSIGYNRYLLVQEYMGYRPGEDLRVIAIGGEVIGAMRRYNTEGDFRSNIALGSMGAAFNEVTPNIRFIARRVTQLLGLEIAGLDLLFTKEGFAVCEVNANMGFEGFKRYCGIDPVNHIVYKFKQLAGAY